MSWKVQRLRSLDLPPLPHAFASHPDVPEADRLALQKALIDLKNTETGAQLLESIRFEGIESATDEDWDDVRDLNITVLVN